MQALTTCPSDITADVSLTDRANAGSSSPTSTDHTSAEIASSAAANTSITNDGVTSPPLADHTTSNSPSSSHEVSTPPIAISDVYSLKGSNQLNPSDISTPRVPKKPKSKVNK